MRPSRNPGSRPNYREPSFAEGIPKIMKSTKQKRYMENLRNNPAKCQEFKAKDSKKKRLKREEEREERLRNEHKMMEYREKERLRKKLQREKKKEKALQQKEEESAILLRSKQKANI